MSGPIIKVENLSKRYVLGQQQGKRDGLRHAVEDALRNPVKWLRSRQARNGAEAEEFWALRNVSFEINQGDVVGIIGRNGAGKSTLLKILSRITEPTEGRIQLDGRVASLLEVGTGFHQELTGRENVFLNGAILGMAHAEIKRKFDEIVAFSEIEKFLDTPVKRYSSGMYVRLAFAVAAHLEPEILIVDEVLAVGDAQFQKKCLGKMSEVARGGRTVLFVSHNMGPLLQLTKTALVLEKGRVGFAGSSAAAVEHYLMGSTGTTREFYDVSETRREFEGTQAVRFHSFQFKKSPPIFASGETIQFTARVRARDAVPELRFSMTVFSSDSTPVGSCFSRPGPGLPAGSDVNVEVALVVPYLAAGHYHCGVAVGKGDNASGHVDFDVVLEILAFEIMPSLGESGTTVTWQKDWGNIQFSELVVKRTVD